jgi:hypothetical protein
MAIWRACLLDLFDFSQQAHDPADVRESAQSCPDE